jgi:hypothetical protein
MSFTTQISKATRASLEHTIERVGLGDMTPGHALKQLEALIIETAKEARRTPPDEHPAAEGMTDFDLWFDHAWRMGDVIEGEKPACKRAWEASNLTSKREQPAPQPDAAGLPELVARENDFDKVLEIVREDVHRFISRRCYRRLREHFTDQMRAYAQQAVAQKDMRISCYEVLNKDRADIIESLQADRNHWYGEALKRAGIEDELTALREKAARDRELLDWLEARRNEGDGVTLAIHGKQWTRLFSVRTQWMQPCATVREAIAAAIAKEQK